MALRLIEGFDSLPFTQIAKRWRASTSSTTFINITSESATGKVRTGTNAIRMRSQPGTTARITYQIPYSPTSNGVLGFGLLANTLSATHIIATKIASNGESYIVLVLNGGGTFSVYRDTDGAGLSAPPGVLLATSTNTIVANTWHYIEWRTTVNGTTGQSEVRVNGNPTPWINISSANTQAVAGVPEIRGFQLGAYQTNDLYFDDVYYLDGNSSAGSTTFLGDCRVNTVFPSSDGNQTDFTPSTGSDNYAMVDEVVPDDDTTYNQSSTVNNVDLYGFPDAFGVGVSANVFGVQVSNIVRKTDAGPAAIAPVIRSNSTDYVGANSYLAISYFDEFQIYENDPATSLSWTTDGVNNAEFGLKRTV